MPDIFDTLATPQEDVFDALAPAPVVPAERGLVGETVAGFKRGGLQLVDMAGNIARAVDPAGGIDVVRNAGLGFSKFAKERALQPDVAASAYIENNPILGNIPKAAEMVIPSVGVPLAIGAGAAAAGVSAPVATAAGIIGAGTAFGLSQFTDTRERAVEKGLPDDWSEGGARIPAVKTALSEGVLEAASNIIPAAKIFKLGKPVAGQVIKSMFGAPTLKAAVKTLINDAAQIMTGEVSTEMAQAYTQGLTEKNAGIRPDADPWQEAKDVIGPTIALSLMLGGAVGGANKLSKVATQRALQNQNVGEDVRTQAADNVYQGLLAAEEAGTVQPGAAENFLSNTREAIKNKAPLTLSDELLMPRVATPEADLFDTTVDVPEEAAAANIVEKLANGTSPSDAIDEHNAEVADLKHELNAVRDEKIAEVLSLEEPAPELSPTPQALSPDLSTPVDNIDIAPLDGLKGHKTKIAAEASILRRADTGESIDGKEYDIVERGKNDWVKVPKEIPTTTNITFNGADVATIQSPTGADVTHHFTSGTSGGGSEYVMTADGQVQRNKGVHSNTGGQDAGLKSWNNKVLFLEDGVPQNAGVAFNTTAHTAMSKLFEVFGRNKVSIQYKDGVASALVYDGKVWRQATWGDAFQKSAKQLGIQDEVLSAKASTTPQVGLNILDYSTNSDGGVTAIHNGSPVTAVTEVKGKGVSNESVPSLQPQSPSTSNTLPENQAVAPMAPLPTAPQAVAGDQNQPVTPNQVKGSISVYNVDDRSAIGYDSETGVYTLREAGAAGPVNVATYEVINGKIQNFKTDATSRDGFDREQQIQEAQSLVEKIEAGRGGVKFAAKGTGDVGRDENTVGSEVASRDGGKLTEGAERPAGGMATEPPLVNADGSNKHSAEDVLRDAEKRIESVTGKRLPAGSLRVVPGTDHLSVKLNKISAAWGKKVVVFEAAAGVTGAPGGIRSGLTPDTIYINKSVDNPHLVTLGHELAHAIEADSFRNKDGIYAEFEQAVRDELNTEVYAKYVTSYNQAHSTNYTGDTMTAEAIAETVGHMLTKTDMLEHLKDTNPTLFKKIVQALIDLLTPLVGAKYHAQLTELIYKDYSKIQKAAAKMLSEFEATNAGGGATQFSAAEEAGATTEGQKEKAAKMWAEKGVESPFFKKWFRGSKVVDADGKPLVVYHGTDKSFDSFDAAKAGAKDSGFLGAGFYFTADPETAAAYADYFEVTQGQNMMPVYLKLENPYVWPQDRLAVNNAAESKAITEELKAAGYDGVVYHIKDSAIWGSKQFLEVVAFSPTQIKSAIGNQGTFDAENLDIRFSASPEARPWYSKLESLFTERLKSVNPEKPLPRSHFEAILKDKGLKADEIKASGIEDFLKTKERFTAKEVQDELKGNAVALEDVVLGEKGEEPLTEQEAASFTDLYHKEREGTATVEELDELERLRQQQIRFEDGAGAGTHFSQYTEPGAKEGSYREMFVTAPNENAPHESSNWTAMQKALDSGNQVQWRDGHSQYSDVQNPVVRIRFNERISDGKKILFVEEMQGPSDQNQNKMPEYLSKRIYDLGVKRVLSYAKENGFDGVAWTKGQTQADRYSLEKEIDRIEYEPMFDGQYDVIAFNKNEQNVFEEVAITKERIAEVFGKEFAAKMEKGEGDAHPDAGATDWKVLKGANLKVGGEGLKKLYDKTLPSLFKKYGGEAVGEVTFGGTADSYESQMAEEYGGDAPVDSMTAPYIPITDATPSSQMKFAASLNDAPKAAKVVTNYFKDIPYGQIATDLTDKVYRFIMPIDRSTMMAASQKEYAPIKSLLNQFVRQRKEKAGRIQSDMTDGAHIWKRFEKSFKTDAEVQNFTDMVWNATEYELHADGATSGWTAKSWDEAGMKERTGESLGEAKKIVADQYKKLSPEQKIVHQEMVHHVQQMYLAGRQAELAWLDQVEVKKAEAWLLNEEGAKPELADLVKEVNEHYPTLRGDYMPLMRFGNLIVRTYEADENGEIGARTRTEFFDSPQEAKAYVEATNKTPGKHAKLETNPEYRRDVVNIPASLVDKISKAAEKQGITGDALEDLKQSIEGIRANMLPRNSIASSKLHREGVAGYEKDVIRVYLTYVRNHALANAQLTHGAKIEQTFRDMRNEVDSISSEPDYDVDAVRHMSTLIDSLYDVEKSGSREKVNEFTKTVGKVTFMWYLSSPSVWAVQWSQPFMVTIPKMAARHGFGKAFSAYTQAAKRFLHGDFSDDKIDAFDRSHEYVGQRVADILERSREAKGKEREDLDKELKAIYESFKDPKERRLLILKVLSHQGQIDLAMAHNAQDIVAGAKGGEKVVNSIIDKAAFFMQKSETGSRRAAAISAFELALERGDGFTAANDYTTHIISDTLMDFDAQNRGAAWRGNTGRILGQFQFFRMHMMGKLIQLTKDAIGGEYDRALAEATTGEEKTAAKTAKTEARKELAFVMGSSFALAGAAGTPLALLLGNTGMSAIWGALAFMFGDDDDPWDPEREFELAMRETLGDTVGNVVLKGLPSLVGADISRRIGLGGMGNVISGEPPAGLTGTAKANWYAGRILGPSWGMVSDTIRMSDALVEGDLSMAIRYGSPKVMRDVVKMFNIADQGVVAGGKTLLKPEDVSVWAMALMFSGINPTEVSLAQEESRYLKNISTELSQRRSKLIRHLAEATVEQDHDAKEEAMEKINKWSETNPSLKISQQEVVQKIKKVRDGQAGKLTKREQLVQDEFGKK